MTIVIKGGSSRAALLSPGERRRACECVRLGTACGLVRARLSRRRRSSDVQIAAAPALTHVLARASVVRQHEHEGLLASCGRVSFKQRSDQRARLDISNGGRTCLPTRFCGLRGRSAQSAATLRHGQSRSVLRRFLTGARCQASPRSGRRLRAGANHSRGDELIESVRLACRVDPWRDELRDHASMSRDGDTFAGLDPPDVTAQIVLELPDTCGGHDQIIATCGHIGKCVAASIVPEFARLPTVGNLECGSYFFLTSSSVGSGNDTSATLRSRSSLAPASSGWWRGRISSRTGENRRPASILSARRIPAEREQRAKALLTQVDSRPGQ